MAQRIIEWEVRPLDEYMDTIEVHFYDSKKEALADKTWLTDRYPEAKDWLFEKVQKTYADDGDLVDCNYTTVAWD